MTTQHQQSIPLNKLVLWDGNVRKTAGADTALAELAASIAAHGLLQPLVVRENRRGRYAVVAGGRRLAALQSLADAGKIRASHPIACTLLSGEVDATEASLAENAMREDMHPADQFEAFRELADRGLPVADIAARFGTSESTVEKRLRLARVAPVVLEAYRRDELTLECVMAFAVSDDHDAQAKLWRELPEDDREAHLIRAALTESDIAASDPRVKFVGLKAYEKAGGATRRDLFSEGEDGVFILDARLLEQLAAKKLEKAARSLRKEGWKWVESRADFDYSDANQFERRYAESLPLSEQEAAELAALEQELDASYDIEGDLTPDQQARFDLVSARMDELTDDREESWPAETLTIAGAVVSIGYDGKAKITRGLVRAEDAPPKPAKAKKPADGSAPESALPASLIESLTAQRSAALTATMIDKPDIALAAVVHLFAAKVFCGHRDTSLDVLITPQRFRLAQGSKAHGAIEAARESWGERLPGDPDQLLAWCLEQPRETLLDLLAFCAALTIDAVAAKGRPDAGRIAHADALASAMAFDIGAWFQPTAENYFSRISKPQTLSALQEAKGVPPAPAWGSLKKAELAALAEREIAGTGWLPAPLKAAA